MQAQKRPARRPGMTAAPGPAPLAPRALTCAARRRRPQQQQQQQQGQQRGARAERAARFPAGVDVHAGGARVGARGDARARGARPGQRTRRGRHNFRKSWGAGAGQFSLWRWLSGRGRLARSPTTGGRARPWPAGRPGPRSARSPSPPPTPSRLLLAAAAPRPAPRGRSARVRSCASRGDEECGPRLGRRALFSPVPPSLSPGRHPRRLSIPTARSKSEPGAGLGRAGPRLPLGAAGEGVGTAGESRRRRGRPGAGADVGRGRRPGSLERARGWARGPASEPRSPLWPPALPVPVPAPGRAPGNRVEGHRVGSLWVEKKKKVTAHPA